MDTTKLIPSIAQIYNRSIESPEKVMELFNDICTALSDNQKLLDLHKEAEKQIDELQQENIELKEKLSRAEKLAECFYYDKDRMVRDLCHLHMRELKITHRMGKGFDYDLIN